MAEENLTNITQYILREPNFQIKNEISITRLLWMSPSLVYIQTHAKNSGNKVILNQESTRCLDAKLLACMR